MAEFVIEGDQLQLRMSRWEHVTALNDDVTVPLSTITSVQTHPQAWAAVNGMRFGTDMPGLLLAGRFTSPHGVTIAICHRSKPGIEIRLTTTDPWCLIASIDNPDIVADQIRAAAGLPRRTT